MDKDTIEDLNRQIADLKKRWPSHSVPPAMMAQLDELEEKLADAQKLLGEPTQAAGADNPALRLQAIGFVENEFKQPAAPDTFTSAESRLVIDPALVSGLQGLEAGQQILVIFYFHRSSGFELLQHPRGDKSRPQRGVFALRSPNRPNPIGVTAVKLLGIEGNVLRVVGLDACSGTPVLDIKPA
jgi:tRNA (adenine37-N6)-methyltransferase